MDVVEAAAEADAAGDAVVEEEGGLGGEGGLHLRGDAEVAGETVLIHGATGGVGSMAVQLARAAGLRVIGTGGSEAGRKLGITRQCVQAYTSGHMKHVDTPRAQAIRSRFRR